MEAELKARQEEEAKAAKAAIEAEAKKNSSVVDQLKARVAEQAPKDLLPDLPKSLASPFSQLCLQIFWRSDTKLSGKS